MYNMTKYWGDIPYCVPPTKLLGGHVPLVPRGFGVYGQGISNKELHVVDDCFLWPYYLAHFICFTLFTMKR